MQRCMRFFVWGVIDVKNTTLLVVIHNQHTQKWAGGHKEPTVTFWETHTAGNGDRFFAGVFVNYFV